MSIEEHTIIILVKNEPGVLSRVAGVFSGRGYNIKTLCVAETTNPEVSRITLTSNADTDFTEKIKKQLDKLVNVVDVLDYTGEHFLKRELMLLGLRIPPERYTDILQAVNTFGCRIVAMRPDYYILETTGDPAENDAVLRYFQTFDVEMMNRTGSISLPRDKKNDPV
jgi:acetolactate synthase I/III small subunit